MELIEKNFYVQTELIVKYQDRFFKIHDKGEDWYEGFIPRFSIVELNYEDKSFEELEDIEPDTELYDDLLDLADDWIAEGKEFQSIANKLDTPVDSDIVIFNQAIERVVILGQEIEHLDALSIIFDRDKKDIAEAIANFKRRLDEQS